jgi:hypothetical protein
MSSLAFVPVGFSPEVENVQPDEPTLARELPKTMLTIAEKTYADGGHALRAVHAKSHGLLRVRVEVADDLPPELAQGVFAAPRGYDAVIRLSTTPGDLLHDSISTPRGLALKLLGVDGERLPGSETSASQDFVLVNGKEFNSSSGRAFLRSLKLLAATTDRMEGTKAFVAGLFKTMEGALEALGTESSLLKTLGGNPETHILGDSFFSQLPLRHGRYIAKYAVVPASDNLKALTGAVLDTGSDPDAIRHAVVAFFERQAAVWHLQAQLCADLEAMPVEGVAPWDEAISPFVTLARVVAQPQPAWTAERAREVDDGMRFSPWNGIAAHRPLGAIMRLRKLAYDRSAAFRSQRNETPVTEPITGDDPSGPCPKPE